MIDLENIQSRYGLKKLEKIQSMWPRLKRWFSHWYETQGVKDKDGKHTNLFKWYGELGSSLGSGMDDWPRWSKSRFFRVMCR
jgi:hypothetical protein